MSMPPIPFKKPVEFPTEPERSDGRPGKEMSFIDHLEELRWHILRSVAAVCVFTGLAFGFKKIVFDSIIFGPKNPDFLSYRVLCSAASQLGLSDRMCIVPPDFVIANFSMMGEFTAHIQMSFIVGFLLGFPYLLWEFWRFVSPGLHDKEIQTTRGIVAYCSLLFALGVSFGYFIIVPFSINFLIPYSISDQVTDYIQLSDYIGFLSMTVLAAGIMFELPIVVYFLSKLGIVSASFLRSYRRHAVVIILVLAAVITPPDALSQILIAMPVLLLYEIGIWIATRIERKRAAEDKARYG